MTTFKVVNDSIKLAKEITDPKKHKACDEALKAYGIPSLAALINGMTPNSNVFDGRKTKSARKLKLGPGLMRFCDLEAWSDFFNLIRPEDYASSPLIPNLQTTPDALRPCQR
jgi:hypothetical protein